MCVNVFRANAPLTLLTANQPMPAVTLFNPAGNQLPRKPNGMREAIICGTPNFGPWADSTACVIEPSKVPTVNATAACQNDRPKAATPSTPTKIVANSRLGDVQVQSICRAEPCRSVSGMNSAPPGSTVDRLSPYSPSRTSATISTSSVARPKVVTAGPFSARWR